MCIILLLVLDMMRGSQALEPSLSHNSQPCAQKFALLHRMGSENYGRISICHLSLDPSPNQAFGHRVHAARKFMSLICTQHLYFLASSFSFISQFFLIFSLTIKYFIMRKKKAKFQNWPNFAGVLKNRLIFTDWLQKVTFAL